MTDQDLNVAANILELSPEEQAKILNELRQTDHSNGEIAKMLSLPLHKYTSLCSKLNLPPKKRRSNFIANQNKDDISKEIDVVTSEDNKKSPEVPIVEEPNKPSTPVKEEPSVAALAVVTIPDVSLYTKDNFPFEVTELQIRQQGLLPDKAIICRNPELLDDCRDILANLFKCSKTKLFLGNKYIVVVGYISQ